MKDRARQVLALKAEGKLSKQIAYELGLHIRTVEYHLEEARKELDAVNTYNAVAIAVNKGIIFNKGEL